MIKPATIVNNACTNLLDDLKFILSIDNSRKEKPQSFSVKCELWNIQKSSSNIEIEASTLPDISE